MSFKIKNNLALWTWLDARKILTIKWIISTSLEIDLYTNFHENKIIKSKEFRTNENDWFFPPYKVGNEGLNPPALHGRVGDVTARMIKLIYTHYVSLFLFLFSFLTI